MSAPTASPTPLQRSSWKAEAIRRGNLKISGPIPITEDMPLNEEEEKEFAENGALDRSLQPQDASQEEQHPPQETPSRPVQSPPTIPEHAEHPTALGSNPVVEQPQQETETHERPVSRSPPKVRQLNQVQRGSVITSSPLASPTPFRSTPESAAMAAQKKKRKSGLRNVFRKMFGRKTPEKAEDHTEHRPEDTMTRGHSYHRSEPELRRASPPREPPRTPTGPRISDLPVKELEPLHPLGQHLPYPMNVNAPPASPPKEYLVLDTSRPDFGRRRATLATLPSAATQRHSLDEPRIKMATWEEGHEEDAVSSSGIGIALSSPTQPTPKHDKRRSRSADALHNLFKERASSDRGRSAEIKYWRESYMSGSIYSRPDTARTVDSTPETAKTMETIRSVQMNEPTIQEPDTESFNEMSATLVQADDPQTPTPVAEERAHDEHDDDLPTVIAFNFGNLKAAVLDAPAESTVEHRQSTEISAPPAPPVRSQNRISLEDRVNHLESRYSNLESMTRRVSSRNNRETIILENAPRNLRSRNRSVSASATGSRSHSRSAPSIHQEPMRHSVETVDTDYAPGSPTHVSMPITVGEDSAKTLRYVCEALKHERSARKALETQVRTLQHDVSDLHALVNKLIVSATATSPSYPTPSPDTLVNSSEVDHHHMSCSTPRAPTHYDRGDDAKHWSQHRDSGSLYDGESDSQRQQAFDDAATPDVWATPKEEGFANHGDFFSGSEHERTRSFI
ncbi:hypothetical protein TUN199_09057 [Pyrenophora tritici-repentis]|nr:hypothetical protein Alg130_08994 [Pyrenophora tritici-repentis]KAI0606828.1 hypothetical protein TUN205_08921 [Pyrenophora tritici-repentis]KAI0618956.1 hypothetical protein TUN199_09057 [Pyrenophora tritici-repentis]